MVEDRVSVALMTGLRKPLTYRLLPEHVEKVEAGMLVRVPVMNRTELAVVLSLEGDETVPVARLKYVLEVVLPMPALTPDLLRVAQWMQGYYAASPESVFELMVPTAVRKGMQVKRRRFISLSRRLADVELESLYRAAPQQAKLYRFMSAQVSRTGLERGRILRKLGVSLSSCQALVKKGILSEAERAVEREAYADEGAEVERVGREGFELHEEQRGAVDVLMEALVKRGFATYLLHGVTGSGKTEVYLRLLVEALGSGGSVIFLVPEVALTPQTIGRLRSRLEEMSGQRAVVWHSMLSDGERFDAWRSMAEGRARIVVGARSAVFAPLPDLRLVIVDEEHEPAYKQEETPRYHGRDVAVMRAKEAGALCVLGSATPSFETLFNVEVGKYQVVRMTKRVDDRKLPLVHVVDMRRELAKKRKLAVFSQLLVDKMADRLERGEQVILFLNRRGFDTSLQCPQCGFVAMCDHCSITLTHHRADGKLRCHLCGLEDAVPKVCPQCRSPGILWKGSGTQKVEDAARHIFKAARIVRIDADTMARKNEFREILAEFRTGRIQVLVGTQMIAKGLDFPNVTLVGMIDADVSQHLPDFRAAERTFQLLVQVSGRAGRGDRAGEVVVQTYVPHSPPILYARQQDFDGFAEEEMANRREFRYPPFRRLIHHLFRGKNPDKVQFYAEQWVRRVEEKWGDEGGLEIRGPAQAPVEKIKDFYRFQVWYFVDRTSLWVRRLEGLRGEFKMDREVIEVLDVDPVNLM